MDNADLPAPPLDFDTVPVRDRQDGWTPERQHAFIAALAESGCVTEACRTVGMSSQSAYRLRRHFDAQGFRLAWDTALDYAIRRLSDAVFSRAIHGEPVPHYYQGELVGEHRRYDNRLAMFLLRCRDPAHYSHHLEKQPTLISDEIFAVKLARLMLKIESNDLSLLIAPPPPPKPKRKRRRRKPRGERATPPAVAPPPDTATPFDMASPS